MLLARQYFAARGFEILNFGLEIQESFDFEFLRFPNFPSRVLFSLPLFSFEFLQQIAAARGIS